MTYLIHYLDGTILIGSEHTSWRAQAHEVTLGGRSFFILPKLVTKIGVDLNGWHWLEATGQAFHWTRCLSGPGGRSIVLHQTFGILFPDPPVYALSLSVALSGLTTTHLELLWPQ